MENRYISIKELPTEIKKEKVRKFLHKLKKGIIKTEKGIGKGIVVTGKGIGKGIVVTGKALYKTGKGVGVTGKAVYKAGKRVYEEEEKLRKKPAVVKGIKAFKAFRRYATKLTEQEEKRKKQKKNTGMFSTPLFEGFGEPEISIFGKRKKQRFF